MNRIIALGAVLSLMVGSSFGVLSAWEWTGTTGDWETAGNWDLGTVPTSFYQGASVEVNLGNSAVVTLSSAADIERLYLGDEGVNGQLNTLILANGANLHSGVDSVGVTNNVTTIGRQYASTVTVQAGAMLTAERRLTLGRSATGNTPITDISEAGPSYLNIFGGTVVVTQNGDIDFGNDSA